MANWATDTSYCAYSNPDYDKLYEELKGEMDPEKRKDLIFQMQQILVDDAAVLIDGYYNSSMIYSKKVGSAHIHTADYSTDHLSFRIQEQHRCRFLQDTVREHLQSHSEDGFHKKYI